MPSTIHCIINHCQAGSGLGVVTIREARAAAARWVDRHAAAAPGFAGAFLSGSSSRLPEDAELPLGSDVDVMAVTTLPRPPAKPGKVLTGEVLLDVTWLSWAQLGSAATVLADYHLAGPFRPDAPPPLADPDGRLAALRAAAAPEYPRRQWVLRRCAHARRRIEQGLGPGFDPGSVLGWLFPTGVTTHVLLSAALRNPTVRLRYLAVREPLAACGLLGRHEELLDLLGCASFTPEQTAGHLAAMTSAFDAAAARPDRPARPFGSDITAAARPIAVDAAHELIARGDHREAVFWIAATQARCAELLAPAEPPGYRELLADLGVETPADRRRRARATLDYLPRLQATAEAVLVATPGVLP